MKLVLIANDQVVDLRVGTQLVTMEMLAESSMVDVLLAVRLDFFVTHFCDARSSKKCLTRDATATTLVLRSFGDCGK